jgi:DNA-damage-inducible protein D
MKGTFSEIKKINEDGVEYWLGRDLQNALGYSSWHKFAWVIHQAKAACSNAGVNVEDHFRQIARRTEIERRRIVDVELSRYACHLIIQNGDPGIEEVALGQTYIALHSTRSELQKTSTASAEISMPKVSGINGLYDGLTVGDDRKPKKADPDLGVGDQADSEEWATRLFIATQAEAKIKRAGIQEKDAANQVYLEVKSKVRQSIQDLNETTSENIPTQGNGIQPTVMEGCLSNLLSGQRKPKKSGKKSNIKNK